jgi:hypothetical protein
MGVLNKDPAGDRVHVPTAATLAMHLADIGEIANLNLVGLGATLRTAARDSALIGVFGRLDPATLRMLAEIHPRGRSTPALAILLDVATWRDSEGGSAETAATAGVLRSAGWRVAVMRSGDTTSLAWQLLLARADTGTLMR